MSKYKGLFTFDIENHRYIPVEQTEGLFTKIEMDYNTEPEPLIKNEEIREIIRAWADVNDAGKLKYNSDENSLDDIYRNTITFNRGLSLEDGHSYTIDELCGEWEDYKPKEPLIKDEKIRKAVRAWADVNEETEIKVKGACLVTEFKGLHKQLNLELNCSWTRDGVYTIEELCGEKQ